MGLWRHAHGGEWKRAHGGDGKANRREYQLCAELSGITATDNTIGPIGISILIQYISTQLSESIVHVVGARASEPQRRRSPGRRNSGLVATEPAR